MRRFLGVDADGITHLAFDDYFVPTDKTNALPAWPRANHAPWYAIIAGHAHRVQVRVTPLPIPTDDDLQVCSIVALDEYVMDRLAAGRARLRSTIGSIVAGFAHEVRNPLASILTLTELAIRELKNSYVPFDGLLRIPALVERIERMIRQTLEYGRPPRPVLQTLNAQYVLRAAVRLVETRFPGIEFVFEDAAECSLYSDVQQVEQVLCNLLQNACEADATRVVIRLELEAGGTVLHIRVADNGSGLAEELVPYMFEPFFTSKAHGTGLGLAIARDLARLNGGDIELEENSRSGATFRVTLRSCPEANERAAAERAEAKE